MAAKNKTSGDATRRGKQRKAFPLTEHKRGYFVKTIKGQEYRFGTGGDRQAALQEYEERLPGILLGRDPKELGHHQDNGGYTVHECCDYFLTAKKKLRDSGEMAARSYSEYYKEAELLIQKLGRNTLVDQLTIADFRRLKDNYPESWGIVTVAGHIRRTKAIFNFCQTDELIKPMAYGNAYKPSPVKNFRKDKERKKLEHGLLEFSADEVQLLIQNSDGWLRACILLAIQAGFGAADCGQLTAKVIDFETGRVDYGRAKNGVPRHFPLWPETSNAIKSAMTMRRDIPTHLDQSWNELVFLTTHGYPVWREQMAKGSDSKATVCDNLTKAVTKLTRKLGIGRPGRSYYSLRRTFETVAQDVDDEKAVNYIMGHVDPSMSGVYKQRMSDRKVKKVTDFMHDWLF